MKPFEDLGNFTTFPNNVIDELMPICAPSTWKILCATIRKTVGFHKDEDWISISQYMRLTGIKSKETCHNALIDALDQGFIIRKPYKNSFKYAINRSYEFKNGTESVPKNGTEIVPKSVRNPYPQKKKEILKESIKVDSPDFKDPDQFKKNLALPEIMLYREVTGRIPGMPQMGIIYQCIRDNNFTEETELQPYWNEWVSRGYNHKNLAWLKDWAVNKHIPNQSSNGSKRKREPVKDYDRLRKEGRQKLSQLKTLGELEDGL